MTRGKCDCDCAPCALRHKDPTLPCGCFLTCGGDSHHEYLRSLARPLELRLRGGKSRFCLGCNDDL